MAFEQVEATDVGAMPRWECKEMSFDGHHLRSSELESLGWSFNTPGYSCSQVEIPLGPKEEDRLEVENLQVDPLSISQKLPEEKGGLGEGWEGILILDIYTPCMELTLSNTNPSLLLNHLGAANFRLHSLLFRLHHHNHPHDRRHHLSDHRRRQQHNHRCRDHHHPAS